MCTTPKNQNAKNFVLIGSLSIPKQFSASDGSSVPMISNGSLWLKDILKLATVLCVRLIAVASLLLILWIGLERKGWASEIDMAAISMIESSGGRFLIGDGGHAHGQYQVSDITIKEYVQMTGRDGTDYDAVARWYIEKRIPQMLRHYGKNPNSIRNILWAYNAGIGNVVKGRVPAVTQEYFKKYERLTGVKL